MHTEFMELAAALRNEYLLKTEALFVAKRRSEWYKDEGQRMVGEYDVSFLFAYFDELWDKLLSARKRYAGKVTVQEVATLMMDALPDFCSYFTNIARFAIAGHSGKSPFAEIAKGETFQIGWFKEYNWFTKFSTRYPG